jgi:hypothetical protein
MDVSLASNLGAKYDVVRDPSDNKVFRKTCEEALLKTKNVLNRIE